MYRHLLVALDGSAFAESALALAVALARVAGARLTLVRSAWVPMAGLGDTGQGQIEAVAAAEQYLASMAARHGAAVSGIDTAVPYAPAAEGILLEAQIRKPDLIVLATHGRTGLSRLVLGSVAEAVLAKTPVPLLLVPVRAADRPPSAFEAAARIVVPLDGSPLAEAALPHAAALARATGATLSLLRVVPAPVEIVPAPGFAALVETREIEAKARHEAEAYLQTVADRLRSEGVSVQTEAVVGDPADTIAGMGGDSRAGLVVMATHGRTGLVGALAGSVTLGVLSRARLPVLAVRPIPPLAAEAPTSVPEVLSAQGRHL